MGKLVLCELRLICLAFSLLLWTSCFLPLRACASKDQYLSCTFCLINVVETKNAGHIKTVITDTSCFETIYQRQRYNPVFLYSFISCLFLLLRVK